MPDPCGIIIPNGCYASLTDFFGLRTNGTFATKVTTNKKQKVPYHQGQIDPEDVRVTLLLVCQWQVVGQRLVVSKNRMNDE
jgi:hypothetical protein